MSESAVDLWIPLYLGARIAAVRRRRGLQQKQLAAAVRGFGLTCSDSIMNRFERWGSGDRNARKPSFAHLWVIAEVLGVKVSDLGATEDDYPELALIRRGLATPSLLSGKGNGSSGEGRFVLTYGGRRRSDAVAVQPTLQSSLIRGVPNNRATARAPGRLPQVRPG